MTSFTTADPNRQVIDDTLYLGIIMARYAHAPRYISSRSNMEVYSLESCSEHGLGRSWAPNLSKGLSLFIYRPGSYNPLVSPMANPDLDTFADIGNATIISQSPLNCRSCPTIFSQSAGALRVAAGKWQRLSYTSLVFLLFLSCLI